jgi:hypothetical protein
MIDFPAFSILMFWKTSGSVMTKADAKGKSGTTLDKRMVCGYGS